MHFIPFEKLSKKEKRILNDSKRGMWDFNPVSRKTKNKKVYDRKEKIKEG